jgi:hypothetical protein
MGIKSWRHKAQDREQWRTILKEVKVHQGLKFQKKKRKRKKMVRQMLRDDLCMKKVLIKCTQEF